MNLAAHQATNVPQQQAYTVLVERRLAAKKTSHTLGGRSKTLSCCRSISIHEVVAYTGLAAETCTAAATIDPVKEVA